MIGGWGRENSKAEVNLLKGIQRLKIRLYKI